MNRKLGFLEEALDKFYVVRNEAGNVGIYQGRFDRDKRRFDFQRHDSDYLKELQNSAFYERDFEKSTSFYLVPTGNCEPWEGDVTIEYNSSIQEQNFRNSLNQSRPFLTSTYKLPFIDYQDISNGIKNGFKIPITYCSNLGIMPPANIDLLKEEINRRIDPNPEQMYKRKSFLDLELLN